MIVKMLRVIVDVTDVVVVAAAGQRKLLYWWMMIVELVMAIDTFYYQLMMVRFVVDAGGYFRHPIDMTFFWGFI